MNHNQSTSNTKKQLATSAQTAQTTHTTHTSRPSAAQGTQTEQSQAEQPQPQQPQQQQAQQLPTPSSTMKCPFTDDAEQVPTTRNQGYGHHTRTSTIVPLPTHEISVNVNKNDSYKSYNSTNSGHLSKTKSLSGLQHAAIREVSTSSSHASTVLSSTPRHQYPVSVVPGGCAMAPKDGHDGKVVDMIDTSVIIGNDMNSMNLQERGRVWEDIHGVHPVMEETEAFISAKLDDMEVELTMGDNRRAYDLARQLDAQYVRGRRLRLAFLRSESYNPHKAMTRLMSWFEHKLELFGSDSLARDLALSDLCAESRQLLNDGAFQVAPAKDVAGRTILVSMKFSYRHFSSTAISKAMLYVCSQLMNDQAAQRQGLVWIHALHEFSFGMTTTQRQHFVSFAQMVRALPIKLRAVHYLADASNASRLIASVLHLSLPRYAGHRMRIYRHAAMSQNQRELISLGIPVCVLPFDANGRADLSNHRVWLERQQSSTTAATPSSRSMNTASASPNHASIIGIGAAGSASLNMASRMHGMAQVDSVSRHDDPHMAIFGHNDGFLDLFNEVPETATAATPTADHAGSSERLQDAAGFYDGDSSSSTSASKNDDKVDSESEASPRHAANHGQLRSGKRNGERHQSQATSGDDAAGEVRLSLVESPTKFDILMGRGRPYQDHEGNRFLKSLIATQYDEYDQSPRWGKLAVAEKVTQMIKNRSGRFLQKDKPTGRWAEVSWTRAREKVAHGFRKKREMDLVNARSRKRTTTRRRLTVRKSTSGKPKRDDRSGSVASV